MIHQDTHTNQLFKVLLFAHNNPDGDICIHSILIYYAFIFINVFLKYV